MRDPPGWLFAGEWSRCNNSSSEGAMACLEAQPKASQAAPGCNEEGGSLKLRFEAL